MMRQYFWRYSWLDWMRFGLLVLCTTGYFLPYTWHRSAALTLNAYDLAEFVRVSPAVLTSNPPALTPFLLRLVLCLLCIGFALNVAKLNANVSLRNAVHVNWILWLLIGLNALFCVGLLIWITPPLEYIPELSRGAWNDINLRQWTLLQLGTVIALISLYFGRHARAGWAWITVTLGLLIVACAVNGELGALNILFGLSTRQTPGGGLALTVLAAFGHSVLTFWQVTRESAQQTSEQQTSEVAAR